MDVFNSRLSVVPIIAVFIFFIGSPSWGQEQTEDCVDFNPENTKVEQINESWKIVEGNQWLFDFGDNMDEADRSLEIIQHYGFNDSCFVGRPDPSMSYFLVDQQAPTGSFEGEDCVTFNPATTVVQQSGSNWLLLDGNHSIMSFDSEQEAQTSLDIIQKHNFSELCFVGRPDPSFTYFLAAGGTNTLFEIDDSIQEKGEKFKSTKIYRNISSLESTERISPLFKVNTDLFDSEKITIPLFGESRTFQTTSVEERGEKIVWKGVGEKQSTYATIVVDENDVVGNIHVDEKLYSIKPLGEGFHVAVEVDTSVFVDEPRGWAEELPVKPINWHVEFERIFPLLPIAALNNQIHLMVLYTSNVDGLVLDIEDEITLALEETNDSHINSDSEARYRIVHMAEVDYTSVGVDPPSGTGDDERLADPDDGQLDFVHNLRDEHGADIVLLITDDPSWCGEAADIGGDESQAFAVVDYDCATGYYSFGHEIGHLHGARHIVENDPSDEPFEFGHGICDPTTPNEWRTVMSYGCPAGTGGPRIQYWSNPDVTFAGDNLGTEETHDNARVMDETFEYVCSFRDPGCVNLAEWVDIVGGIETRHPVCFDDLPISGGLSERCIDQFDPCGCGIHAPVCENMLCPAYSNLQEVVVFEQLQQFKPYELIDMGVEPETILPKEGMVMLDSDVRERPIRVHADSAQKIIENNPSWSIRS